MKCAGDIRKADGPCFVWDALVPTLGVFGRCHFVRWNCHGGPRASGRGTVPPQQLRLAAKGE